jgi:hypothetical protein
MNKILESLPEDEQNAVQAAIALMTEIFGFLNKLGPDISGRQGLIEAGLRGCLFLMEEGLDRKAELSDTLVLFLLEEYRQDKAKPC